MSDTSSDDQLPDHLLHGGQAEEYRYEEQPGHAEEAEDQFDNLSSDDEGAIGQLQESEGLQASDLQISANQASPEKVIPQLSEDAPEQQLTRQQSDGEVIQPTLTTRPEEEEEKSEQDLALEEELSYIQKLKQKIIQNQNRVAQVEKPSLTELDPALKEKLRTHFRAQDSSSDDDEDEDEEQVEHPSEALPEMSAEPSKAEMTFQSSDMASHTMTPLAAPHQGIEIANNLNRIEKKLRDSDASSSDDEVIELQAHPSSHKSSHKQSNIQSMNHSHSHSYSQSHEHSLHQTNPQPTHHQNDLFVYQATAAHHERPLYEGQGVDLDDLMMKQDLSKAEEDVSSFNLTQSHLTSQQQNMLLSHSQFLSAAKERPSQPSIPVPCRDNYFKIENLPSDGSSAHTDSYNQASRPQAESTARKQEVLHKLKSAFDIIGVRREERLQSMVGLAQFKANVQRARVQTASQMVQKMSNLSRGFIVAHSLSQIIDKNHKRRAARSFFKMVLNLAGRNGGQADAAKDLALQQESLHLVIAEKEVQLQEQAGQLLEQAKQLQQKGDQVKQQEQVIQEKDRHLLMLQGELSRKSADIKKMEEMFREYAAWRQKLEQIEQKMKQEVDYWKETTNKLQKDNDRLEKEILQMTKDQMAKARDLSNKEDTIKELQAKLDKAAELAPVEEALCVQCKSSMEESIVGQQQKDLQAQLRQQADEEAILELQHKLQGAQKEVAGLREKATFLETLEAEQKKELEEHVEVLLKMEQERLLLLKETDRLKAERAELKATNDSYSEKMAAFETHLNGLKDEIQSSHRGHKELIEHKDMQIAEQAEQIEKLERLVKTRPKQFGANTKSMTGLPMNVVKSKLDQTTGLKFKKTASKPSLQAESPVPPYESTPKLRQAEESTIEDSSCPSTESRSTMGSSKYVSVKTLEAKDLQIQKLRQERDDLWQIVNSEKYRGFRSIEEERDRAEKRVKQAQEEVHRLTELLQQKEGAEQTKIHELEAQRVQTMRFQESSTSQAKLISSLEERSTKQQSTIEQQEGLLKQTTELLEQMRAENGQLKQDVQWLANTAKQNKVQSEKAINDLEEYTKILGLMEAKLKQTEAQRDEKHQECIQLQNCLRKFA